MEIWQIKAYFKLKATVSNGLKLKKILNLLRAVA